MRRSWLRKWFSPAANRPVVHRLECVRLEDRVTPASAGPVFAPGTPLDYVDQMIAAFEGSTPAGTSAFNLAGRWGRTASQSGPLQQGDPTTLTWGILPDGVSIPGGGTEPTENSRLIATLDARFGSGPGGADLTQRPWFNLFTDIFDRLESLTGNTYIYSPQDDAASFPNSPGVLNVRADMRIGGKSIDGGSGTLAYNYYPEGGDMVIDMDDMSPGGFYTNATSNYLGLRNVLSHEHGHGLGIAHQMPVAQLALMEPLVSLAFDGPQLDDLLALHRHYGDALEKNGGNDDIAHAVSLGSVGNNITVSVGSDGDLTTQRILPTRTDFVSIDGSSDTDVFSFTIAPGSLLNLTLRPLGFTYLSGAQGGPPPTNFDALLQNDLKLELLDSIGTVLQTVDVNGLGGSESIIDFPVSSGGTFFARITGAQDAVQLYELSITNEIVTVVPTITRNLSQPALTRTSPIRFDVNFSLPVVGFDPFDIQFGPGTITTGLSSVVTPNGFTGDSYFVDVYGATGQGTVGISLPAGAAISPTLGALTSVATTPVSELVTFDNLSPTPVFSPVSLGLTRQTSTTVTVDFGEPVSALNPASLITANASIQGFTPISASVYEFNILPSGQGAFSVRIPVGVVADLAGNPNLTAIVSGTFDSIAPVATVTRISAGITNVGPAVFEVVFSEPIQFPFNFSFAGSTVGGTLNAMILPEPGIQNGYLVSVSGMTGQGLVLLTVPAGGATDLAGNTTAADAVANAAVLFDTLPPDVAVTIPNNGPTSDATVDVSIVFSERVNGFTSSGVIVSGAGTKSTFTSFGDGLRYSVSVTRTGDGAFTITIPDGAAADLAGNVSNPGTATGIFDTVAPTATVTRISPPRLSVGPAEFRATFNEAITSPFTVSFAGSTIGGTLFATITADPSPTSAPNSYIISVSGMDGEGSLLVTVPAGGAQDLAGNVTTTDAQSDLAVFFDNLSPSVTISSSATIPSNAASIPITVTFSERVFNFTAAGIQTTGAVVVGNFQDVGDRQNFTFDLTSGGDGAFTVTVPAGSATDSDNPNTEGTLSGAFDTAAPTVTVTPTLTTFTDVDVVFNVAFSEPLSASTAFTTADVVLGGTANFKSFTVTPGLTPQSFLITISGSTRSGTITAQVLAGAVADAAGNPSTVSNVATTDFVTTRIPPTTLVGTREYAAGTGPGVVPQAQLINPDGSVRFTTAAFDGLSAEGVRTATGDFTNDGIADLIIGSGPGVPSLIQMIDGATGRELLRVNPFEPSFLGGVFVAVGEISGSGTPEIVVTPDEGGGPRVQIYRGVDLLKIGDFFGITDVNFRGGARAAVGDLNGDGRADVIVSAGFGGGPRIAGFDGAALAIGRLSRLFPDFFVFESTLRNGAYVAAGDVDGDGFADLIAGGGPGGAPRVRVLNGEDLVLRKAAPATIANFFAGDVANRDGIRVAAKNLDDDAFADVVVGAGAGTQITAYYGLNLRTGDDLSAYSYEAFPGLDNGVFVG